MGEEEVMFVADRMTPNPTTVTTDTSLKDAIELIRSKPFRHLPVIDDDGALVGVVTEKSLVYASPTPITTLSIFEVDYVLSRVKVGQLLHREVITVGPDLPVEEAARIMVDNRIGCLPVVQEGRLIGIISDTDIFHVLVEGLGGGSPSLRFTVTVPEQVGSLARITSCTAALGGNIHSLVIFWDRQHKDRVVVVRVEGIDEDSARQALAEDGIEVLNVWKSGCSRDSDPAVS